MLPLLKNETRSFWKRSASWRCKRDFPKVWVHCNCHCPCRWSQDWCCDRRVDQHTEKVGQRYRKWATDNWQKNRFYSPRPHWLDCELLFQSRREGHFLSGQTHLPVDSCVVAFLMERFLKHKNLPNQQTFHNNYSHNYQRLVYVVTRGRWGWVGWWGGGGRKAHLLFLRFHCRLVDWVGRMAVWCVNFRWAAFHEVPCLCVSVFTSLFIPSFMFVVACLSLLL